MLRRRIMTGFILGLRSARQLREPALLLRCRHRPLLQVSHASLLASPLPRSTPSIAMVETSRRRIHGNGTDKDKKSAATPDGKHDHEHSHSHPHAHSHRIFSGHSHSHDDGHAHGGLVETLQGGGDRGSRITLIGLGVNIVLTGTKGVAGWFMNSAALLADAGHSLSDLLGDFVVLFSWRLSRRPPSTRYPFGLAKFETVGTTLVAILLIGCAVGIGAHALSLLFTALSETVATLPEGPLQTALSNVTAAAHNIPAIGHTGHSHAHAHALDPNAAWFAAASVVSKEWLFRITRKVADQENSPVLLANAYHHRSDAYSSVVALVAIMGSSWFPALPLDPIGGLLVAIVILRQGTSILGGAIGEMTDASVPHSVLHALERPLDKFAQNPPSACAFFQAHHLRARRAGSQLFVNLSVDVPEDLTVSQLNMLEKDIVAALIAERKDVKDVQIQFKAVSKVEGNDKAQ
ncbi:cation efflux family-domain-containing protein [Gloeopeniophorella convolvens]|nr:cation efflux family-domain-containing protein [Gloeopeniophorella convolvens]